MVFLKKKLLTEGEKLFRFFVLKKNLSNFKPRER